MLHQCMTAEDVKRLAKVNHDWRQKMFNAPKLEPEPMKTAPTPEPTPEVVAALSVPAPFIPPEPALPPSHFSVNGIAYQMGPSIRQISRLVAKRYGITLLDINSERRTQNIVRPRQIVMYLAKTLTTRSFPYIGFHMGGRDHTTAMHGFKKIERLRTVDPDLDAQLNEFAAILKPQASE